MKKWNWMRMRLMPLFAAFLLLLGCTGSKAERKLLKDAASEIYSELEKSAKEASSDPVSDDKSNDGDSYAQDEEKEISPTASSKYDGVEIPVYTKGNLSETIKHRYSYTVSYNHQMKNPNWVAWSITADHASGKVQRTDFWDDDDMPDPKGYLSDYYNSGYDRGHMCPAGDNKWSEKAMEDCFRITNMCPQDGGLNRGMWNSIEQQCRAWAKKYGKVYVVCGPIYLNQQHRKIGRTRWWCLRLSSRGGFAWRVLRKPSVSSVETSRRRARRKPTSSIPSMMWSVSRVTTSSLSCPMTSRIRWRLTPTSMSGRKIPMHH